MENVDINIMDIVVQNIEKLKKVLPGIFIEVETNITEVLKQCGVEDVRSL